MDFSEALLLMRDGHPVAREVWGQMTYVSLIDGAFCPCDSGPHSGFLNEANVLALDWKRAYPQMAFEVALQALKAGRCKEIRRAGWNANDGLTWKCGSESLARIFDRPDLGLRDLSADDWICE